MSFWPSPRKNRAAPAVIGHRGAPDLATENTARSFELAMSVGADVLETDVHLTADGHIVCFHDNDFQRLCGTPERVDSVQLSDARAIFPDLLLFDDFLALTKGSPIIVDIKFAGSREIDRYVSAVEEHAALERSLFSAYTPAIAALIRNRSAEVNIGTFFPDGAADVSAARLVGARWMRVLPKDYRPGILENLRADGFSTIAVAAPLSSFGTPTDRSALEHLAALRVDAIITDKPELAVEVFRGMVP